MAGAPQRGPVTSGAVRTLGLVALAWSENGFHHMTHNKRPIVSALDAAGLKRCTMENKVHMEGYRTFGILPTPMAFPAVFGALQQGAVDGPEHPIPVTLASKFSQVPKHLSLTGQVYSPALLLTSPRGWNKPSDADKNLLRCRPCQRAGQAQEGQQ